MKKVISVILAAALLLCSVSVFAESTPSDWAQEEVGTVFPGAFTSFGIDLDYQRDITRSEFTMMIFMVYRSMTDALPEIATEQNFYDVGGEMVDAFIPIVNTLGIVKGVSETEFAPRNGLTRQELCTMLCRTFAAADETFSAEAAKGSTDAFADKGEIAEWAQEAMDYCVSEGIIKGMSETELSPTSSVSVEQAMVICNRIMQSN